MYLVLQKNSESCEHYHCLTPPWYAFWHLKQLEPPEHKAARKSFLFFGRPDKRSAKASEHLNFERKDRGWKPLN